MTIAFLCDYYHPFEIGGAERSAERLAIELGRVGARVMVVTPNYGAPASELVNGVAVIRLPFPQRLEPGALARRLWLSNPLLHLLYTLRLVLLIRRRGIRVLHVQNSTLVVPGILSAALTGIPAVVTIRDLAYLPRMAGGDRAPSERLPSAKWRADAAWAGIERRLKRAALRRASARVFVSRALRDLYESSGESHPAKTYVIYNIGPPGDSAEAQVQRTTRTIVFVGKLSTGKGIHVLYEAAGLVARRFPDVVFVMAGSPGVGFTPPPEAVAALFSLRGRLPSDEVQRLMSRAAVLVSPGIWPEPLSRVLLEAMSARLPIVATAVGGNLEVLEHERSGWLVVPRDADALADGICRLLGDPPAATRLAAGARARFDELFSPDAVVPRIRDVYDRAARN